MGLWCRGSRAAEGGPLGTCRPTWRQVPAAVRLQPCQPSLPALPLPCATRQPLACRAPLATPLSSRPSSSAAGPHQQWQDQLGCLPCCPDGAHLCAHKQPRTNGPAGAGAGGGGGGGGGRCWGVDIGGVGQIQQAGRQSGGRGRAQGGGAASQPIARLLPQPRLFSSLSAHPFPVPPPHPQEYLGSYVSDETGRLVFREGLLVQAVRRGHWIVLDELNLAPTEVLEALNRQVFAGQPAPLPRTTAAAFCCAVPGPVPPPPATPAVPAAASGCEERVQGGPRPLPRPKASTIPF